MEFFLKLISYAARLLDILEYVVNHFLYTKKDTYLTKLFLLNSGASENPGDSPLGNEELMAAAAQAAAQAAQAAASKQERNRENRESSSRSSKERKRNSRSNSKSSSQSSPSYGCTVKGTSAIILTPDSIVYNDEGIWSHRYDTSPRPPH